MIELVQKKLKELSDLNNNWIETIKIFFNEEDISPEDISGDEINALKKVFFEFLNLCKTEYKKNPEDLFHTINKEIGADDAQWLEQIIQIQLKAYLVSTTLRNIQEDNEEKVKMILQYLFNNVILRFDPKFHENYLIYGFEKEQDFVEAAQMLDSITNYYIRRHFTRRAIKEDFMDDTDLNDSICTYYSDLIEDNYLTLQLNLMLEQDF